MNNYSNNNTYYSFTPPKKNKFHTILGISFSIIAIIISIYMIFQIIGIKTSYKPLDQILEERVIEYSKNNIIDIETDAFLSFEKLNYKLDEKFNCNEHGGIIINSINDNDFEYLYQCDSFKSNFLNDIETNNNNIINYIKLNGDYLIYLNYYNEYQEFGYESKYNVTINNNIINKVGAYTIEYKVDVNGIKYYAKRIAVVLNENRYNNDAPIIRTTSESEKITISKNENFTIPKASANDKNDGDISNKLEINSNVNTSIPGTYAIIYDVKNSQNITTQKKIQVEVIENNDEIDDNTIDNNDNTIDNNDYNDNNINDELEISISNDLEKNDNISMDDNYIYIEKNTEYIEPEFKITNSDGDDVTDDTTITNNININKTGIYTITAKNNNTIVNKTVIVDADIANTDELYYYPKEMTNGNVEIKLNVGENTEYVILPDNTQTTEKNIKYSVENNDEYIFKICNKKNKCTEKTIYITNIDHQAPFGYCIVENNTLKIYANDASGFKNIQYNYGNGYTTSNTFQLQSNNNNNNIEVKLKDKFENKTTIKCELKNIDIYDKNSGNNSINENSTTNEKTYEDDIKEFEKILNNYKTEKHKKITTITSQDKSLNINIYKYKQEYISHVWIKDPTKQLKKYSGYEADNPKLLDNFKTPDDNSYLDEEYKKLLGKFSLDHLSESLSEKLIGKAFIAINADNGGCRNEKGYKYSHCIKYINGTKIIRNNELVHPFRRHTSIITKHGYLMSYEDYKRQKGNEKNTHNDDLKEIIVQRNLIEASNPLFTINPSTLTVSNGEVNSDSLGILGTNAIKSKTAIQNLCQVDKNNWIIYTHESSSIKNAADVLEKLGCNIAINLDGGSSTATYYRKENTNTPIEIPKVSHKTHPTVYMDLIYFTSLDAVS